MSKKLHEIPSFSAAVPLTGTSQRKHQRKIFLFVSIESFTSGSIDLSQSDFYRSLSWFHTRDTDTDVSLSKNCHLTDTRYLSCHVIRFWWAWFNSEISPVLSMRLGLETSNLFSSKWFYSSMKKSSPSSFRANILHYSVHRMFGGEGDQATLIKIAKSEFVRLTIICVSRNFIVKQTAK